MTIEMPWKCYHAICECGAEWFEPIGNNGPNKCPECGQEELYDLSETRYVDDNVLMLSSREEEE